MDRRTWIGSLAVLVVFLAAWQWGPGLLGLPAFVLPPLGHVAAEFLRMAGEDLWMHTGITALEIVVGFALGALLGVMVGVALGMSPRAEAILSPYILALQIAPKVAFAPLFVMWLGYTVYPKILVAILIVFFPIMVNVLSAIRTVEKRQGLKICCPEEIAWRNGWIDAGQLEKLAGVLAKSGYGEYLRSIVKESVF